MFDVRYSGCVVINTVCDVIYSRYDAINIVGVMSYTLDVMSYKVGVM